jgi:alpha-D-ribose 1-methylphosphonate 5-triphosphate synthase subunit PhnH
METILESGFASPVLEAQTAFRAIMDALANPGTVQNLVAPQTASAHLPAGLASVVLTLTDHDTPAWLSQSLQAPAVREFVGFHTGAPIVQQPGRAAFAFAASAAELPPLDQFNLGTQEYPDRSTTIVLAVEALTGGKTLVIRGPGIKDHAHISPHGLPENFVAQWAANRELFPRGIDLLLIADGQVMGLPRSTRIGERH